MNARWIPLAVLLPLVHAGCIFPDVTLDEASGSATSSAGGTTSQGPASSGSTATATSTTGGDGGGGTSTGSSGGAEAGGGGAGGDGGNGGGSTGPGGSGFCPVTDCRYLDDPGAGGAGGQGGGGGSTTVLDDDCDDDGDPNGTDCQPCDDRVYHRLPDDEYFVMPYDTLDGGQSFDYNCVNGGEYDLQGPKTCGSFLFSTCPPAVYTVQPQCGEFRSRQSCAANAVTQLCGNSGQAADQQVGCH